MRGCTPRPAAVAPNSNPSGLASSAITRVPGGSSPGRPSRPSPGSRGADPQAPLDPPRVEGAQGHSRLDDRDRQRVVEQAPADEAAALHALQRDRLHRRLLLVGVEPDVAVEDAVGPGDRLVAEVDRLRAREPVREGREALLDLAWSAAGAVLDQQVAQGEARELLPQLGRHPARLGNGLLAHQRSSRARRWDWRSRRWTSPVSWGSESSSVPTFANARMPPG